MATPEELAALTDENAAGPRRAVVDGNSAEQHSIQDMIALEKHRAANSQASSAKRLIFNKISPPGAI